MVQAFAAGAGDANVMARPPPSEVIVLEAEFADELGQLRVVGGVDGVHAQAGNGFGGDPLPIGIEVTDSGLEENQADEVAVLSRQDRKVEEQCGGGGVPGEEVGAAPQQERGRGAECVEQVLDGCGDLG
ncbi:hypothetical protein Asi02nite_50570 [Asanoa siamensis]|uniref:Uncharacterized protein n=1 Tax=Asanoa siamensis TaxID=926357 RepID=A0ABQ4CW79_9ACTN|nr:hypothetical protein Asi02nite_50570 [Asanoa siamensis]